MARRLGRMSDHHQEVGSGVREQDLPLFKSLNHQLTSYFIMLVNTESNNRWYNVETCNNTII